jgi:hypothetical protein
MSPWRSPVFSCSDLFASPNYRVVVANFAPRLSAKRYSRRIGDILKDIFVLAIISLERHSENSKFRTESQDSTTGLTSSLQTGEMNSQEYRSWVGFEIFDLTFAAAITAAFSKGDARGMMVFKLKSLLSCLLASIQAWWLLSGICGVF